MQKEILVSEASSKLNQMGISNQVGAGADIVVNCEFLDAGWSTGSKKISYESSVFFDERIQTVFMYEKTTEVGHGLSFGGGSGSSFQSGITLFRKVKSIQYSAEGKVYEYTLNLGAIPKTVKEVARQNGWKFKTVLNKNKARYPEGYVTISNPPVTEQSQQPMQPKTTCFCCNCGMKISVDAAFCNMCGKPTGRV